MHGIKKYSPPELLRILRSRTSERNFQLIIRFFTVVVILISTSSILFHLFMALEGKQYNWFSGVYWTIQVITTLGFGDITFTSFPGQLFTVIVHLVGIILIFISIPFIFIQFFQSEARVPREMPAETSRHVIITKFDPVTRSLIGKLIQYKHPYVLLISDLSEALQLHDQGFKVLLGEIDNPETYLKIRVEKATMVITSGSDQYNANVAFTVREVNSDVPIIATAEKETSVQLLKLAGSSRVLQPAKILGGSLARRTIGGDAMAHIIGQFDQLLIAEAMVASTPLVGKTIRESQLREILGLTVVGVWERGKFEIARKDTIITEKTVLVLAGSKEQLQNYNELFCIYHMTTGSVIIIGGGRVGKETAEELRRRGIEYRIIEKMSESTFDNEHYIWGDASNLVVLKNAGIMESPTVIITTHDDDTNIYLTLLCRQQRPDIQIISRSTMERNVASLHRAGADFVMSYASMGSNTLLNLLKRSNILMLTEGLDVFKLKLPHSLINKTLAESEIRQKTGCSVIAVLSQNEIQINPKPDLKLPAESEIVLIGSMEAEDLFLKHFVKY
jgi:voltage-gated potassium channel